ncbi:MAG: thiol peroxidase [Planctomycetes bacterium]|nr:thiol peroxidase [Planctomycetota bacterium]
MARFTLKGNPFTTVGELPKVGAKAPAFALVKGDLSPLATAAYAGKRVVLNIFPSIDTPTCATSVRTFNKRAAEAADTAVVCVSMDLPFALSRFCGAEGIDRVAAASAFRSTFGKDFGLLIADGPLQGLLARAVIVLDSAGMVRHAELVPEIANEPDYAKALAATK